MIIAILTLIILAENIFLVYKYKSVSHNIALKKEESNTKKIQLISEFIDQLTKAEKLRDIYVIHIKIWANGIRHANFGPDPYGMFRTKDILLMTPDEVYLGNIWGLNTLSLTTWENQSPDDQKLVIKQYREHLINNLKYIKQNVCTN